MLYRFQALRLEKGVLQKAWRQRSKRDTFRVFDCSHASQRGIASIWRRNWMTSVFMLPLRKTMAMWWVLERTASSIRSNRTFFSELPKGIITPDFTSIGDHDPCGTNAKLQSSSPPVNPKNALGMSNVKRPFTNIGCMVHANILTGVLYLQIQIVLAESVILYA